LITIVQEGFIEPYNRPAGLENSGYRQQRCLTTGIKEVEMDREDLKETIKMAAKDGRITCAAAFRVAEEASLTVGLVGGVINEMGIKITTCQLGCF